MKTPNTKYLIGIVLILLLHSCSSKKQIEFLISESEMIRNNKFGLLLEYAIWDNTKIELVNKIICDSVEPYKEFSFGKTEILIKDSSYYFFDFYETKYFINDYIGVIYLDINEPDSVFYYCEDFKYHINDFDLIVNEIVNHNNSTIEKTLKYRKVGSKYVPHFYFIVSFHTMDCADKFIETSIEYYKKINGILDKFIERNFGSEIIDVEPFIEIRITFTNKDS